MSAPEFLRKRTRPLPRVLKDLPVYRFLSVHMNFGREGGAATYSFYEKDGQPLPFTFRYRTGSKKPGVNFEGYFLDGREDIVLSAPELHEAWPGYVAEQEEAQS